MQLDGLELELQVSKQKPLTDTEVKCHAFYRALVSLSKNGMVLKITRIFLACMDSVSDIIQYHLDTIQ